MKPLYLILLAVAAVVLTGCYPEPVANFDYSYDDNTAPALVTFSNYSTDADEYRWDFGDGNVSTTMSPTHTYQEAGTYTITLLAKSRGGESNMTKSITIEQPTTYVVRNSTSFRLYTVYSYYWDGSDTYDEVNHGDLPIGNETQEIITTWDEIYVDFEASDGTLILVLDAFPITANRKNILTITDETEVYVPSNATKSVQSREDLNRMRETGKRVPIREIL